MPGLGPDEVDPSTGLPYVDHDTGSGVERRVMGALWTPDNHLMRSVPSWTEATGLSVIPRSQWAQFVFRNYHSEIPILDQNGQGACVGFASTGAFMIARSRQGLPYVPLSASFLYTLINGGVDMGANSGDAVQAMQTYGIAPISAVPGTPIRPKGVNASAKAAALDFTLRKDGFAQITGGADEAVTAILYGWQIIFDVRAGGRYTTDSDGTIAYLGARTNHEQQCGEGLVMLPSGQFTYPGRNSWGTSWGVNGTGNFTDDHLNNSNSIWAIKYANPNPQDPGFLFAALPPAIRELRGIA